MLAENKLGGDVIFSMFSLVIVKTMINCLTLMNDEEFHSVKKRCEPAIL